jgi:hypothetical protein
MRNISVVSGILILLLSSCSQFKLGQNDKLDELTAKVDSLMVVSDSLTSQNKFQDDEISWLANELVELKKTKSETPAAMVTNPKQVAPASLPAGPATKTAGPATKTTVPATKSAVKAVADLQCIAITNSGKRCSRPALTGSKYCLQHKQIYEPDK